MLKAIMIPIISGLLVAIVGGIIMKKLGKMDEKADIREAYRRTEASLILQSIDAGADIDVIMANCLRDVNPDGKHKVDGNLDKALEHRIKLQEKLNSLIYDKASN